MASQQERACLCHCQVSSNPDAVRAQRGWNAWPALAPLCLSLGLSAVWLSIIIGLPVPAWAQSEEPLAVVAGEPIHEADLLPLVSGQMQQLRQQEYEIKSQALDKLIDQRLLESEAARENISPNDLLKREADSKVPAPTDAEVEAVYNAQKARIKRPLEDVKDQIQQYLNQSRINQARTAYFKTLRARADIDIRLQPPRVEVSYDPTRVVGPADAPITIVEFSDFQCPFCKRAHPIIKQLLAKYPEQVKLAYRDFPLRDIHPQAQAAAEASRCALDQGKFWPFHDQLFESGMPLNRPSFLDHAAKLGMDTAQFGECLSDNPFVTQIQKDVEDGKQAGVNGTPAFFINGVAVTGAQPLDVFEKVVDQELATIRRSQATQQPVQ